MKLFRGCWTGAVLYLIVGGGFIPVAAQGAPKSSADVMSCSDCTHYPVVAAELGRGNTNAPVFSLFSRVSRDSRGRIFVGPVNNFSGVAVFSAAGNFEKLLGGVGEGPGEFRSVTISGVLPGDSVWVFDSRIRRLSIFGPDLRFARSVPFMQHQALVFAPSGVITGLGDIRSENRIGKFIHQYAAATGNYLRSLGPEKAVSPGTNAQIPFVSLMSDRNGQLWSAGVAPVRFVSYGETGAASREVMVQPPWLPFPALKPRTKPGRPATAETPATAAVPLEPIPTVNSVTIAANGDFWILGALPSADWRTKKNPFEPLPAESKGVKRRSDPSDQIELYNGWYNTIVESVNFDPSGRARTVVRAKIRTGLAQMLSDGLVAGMAADSDGVVSITVWKLQSK